jgi:hypothetical protein
MAVPKLAEDPPFYEFNPGSLPVQAVRAETSSTSSDQAVLVDQTGGVSLPSDAVLVEIDRFG